MPGTFFVVGSMVARHPDMAQRVVASGSEIGVHTFTHPDLAGVSDLRRDREIADTELAIAGATGVSTHLVRPPFSSTSDALDDPGYGTVLAAGRQGYVTVLTDVDGEDWQRPGVDAIVRNATPQNGAGATVLLHDAGGDRAQTVAALDRLIPQLQAQGYRFATVSDAAGLGPHGQPAPSRDRMVGQGLLATVGVAQGVVTLMEIALIGVGGLVIARLVVMLVVARRHAKRRRDPSFSWGEPVPTPCRWSCPPTTSPRTSRRPSARSSRTTIPSRSWWSTTAPPTAPPTCSRTSPCPGCASCARPTPASPRRSTGAWRPRSTT